MTKMNRNRLTDTEDRSVVAKWEGAVGQMEWEDGIGRCKLLYIGWMNNKVLLHSPDRRTWQPTPAFLPGKSHGQRSLAGCSSWGHKKSWTQLGY